MTLAGLGCFFCGIIGFIRPSWIKLSSRWQAAALWLFSGVLATAGGEFYPTKDTHQEDGATVVMIISTALVCAFVIFLRVAFRAAALSNGAAPRESASGQVERLAQKWAASMPKYRSIAANEPVSERRTTSENEERRKFGEAFIKKLGERPKRQAATLPVQPIVIPCEDYYSDSDDGEHGRVLRRGAYDSSLSFEYANRQGEITIRTLHQWVEYPQYLQGWCQDAGDNRTFRKDRVLEWFAGREELRAPKGKSRL